MKICNEFTFLQNQSDLKPEANVFISACATKTVCARNSISFIFPDGLRQNEVVMVERFRALD